jgi:hypothetical protein
MIQLIWGILNVAIFIAFIVICFQAIKFIREKLGLFACIIFALGLLSFNSKPNDNNSEFKQFDLNNKAAKVTNNSNTRNQRIVIEDNLFSKMTLSVNYTAKEMLNAQSSREGFISGTNWHPISIIVNKSNGENQYVYSVYGTLEWRLLGITIYSQLKKIEGKIELAQSDLMYSPSN